MTHIPSDHKTKGYYAHEVIITFSLSMVKGFHLSTECKSWISLTT